MLWQQSNVKNEEWKINESMIDTDMDVWLRQYGGECTLMYYEAI